MVWNTLIGIAWQTSEPRNRPVSPCPVLGSSACTTTPDHIPCFYCRLCFLVGVLGISLGFSFLHGKHFSNLVILLAWVLGIALPVRDPQWIPSR